MIVRSWRGYASPADPDAYALHLVDSVLPKLEQVDGFQGAYLLRQSGEQRIEYLVLTLWESMDAIRKFAGDDPDRAVVEPAAKATLVDFDEHVQHYEVIVRPTTTFPEA